MYHYSSSGCLVEYSTKIPMSSQKSAASLQKSVSFRDPNKGLT